MPFEPSATVTGVATVVITGLKLSTTVTVIVWVVVLPDPSVATTVIVFAPRSAQVNVVGEAVMLATLQLSEAFATSCAVLVVPAPLAFKNTVTGVETSDKVGFVLSTTDTVKFAVLVLPDPSTAVTLTVLLPKSEHVNTELLYNKVTGPHASVAVATVVLSVATPAASRTITTGDVGAVITGAVLSTTWIVLDTVETFPEASTAVATTVTLPRSSQDTAEGLIVTTGAAVQLSTVELIILLRDTVPAPVASSVTT
jgi:hypothetical protein